jgi:hypothetical protein
MAVQETLADRVRVLLGVGVAVVGAVEAGPPASATLNGGSATGGQEDLERERGLVARVSPEAMVASS